MQEVRDLTDQRFGKLVVMGRDTTPRKGKSSGVRWVTLCDCGTIKTIRATHLIGHPATRSCGCLLHEVSDRRNYKHGMAKTRTYHSYTAIIHRCNNPTSNRFRYYGGRGIVCEWQSFEEFYRDMGDCPSLQHSIDRIDNNGPYCKENCRWATREQQANNKSNNVFMTYQGLTLTLGQWAKRSGIPLHVVHHRFRSGPEKGWTPERILTEPVGPYRKKVHS